MVQQVPRLGEPERHRRERGDHQYSEQYQIIQASPKNAAGCFVVHFSASFKHPGTRANEKSLPVD
jgi:hypothetical protein